MWGLRFSGEKIKVSVVLSYWLIELLTYRVNCVSHSATRSIRLWLCRWCSAKRRCLFSLFASTTFQERHCAPASPRMYQNGTQGRLSFQGCKPTCCTCRTGGWYAFLVLVPNSPLTESLYPYFDGRGGYSEQVAEFPFAHGGCLYIGRQGYFAVLVYADDVPFHILCHWSVPEWLI